MRNTIVALLFFLVLGRSASWGQSPPTPYTFKLQPIAILDEYSKLGYEGKGKTSHVDTTAAEWKLFRDAADSKLDSTSLADAFLLASGVTNEKKRSQLRKQLKELVAQARPEVTQQKTAIEKGDRLLQWLHAGPLSAGYSKNQSSLATLLESRQYNCVSSTAIYLYVGTELGFEIQAVEIPEHVFGLFCLGDQKLDVETTNQRGFNPSRNREALKQPGGTVYIPEKHKDKRREVDVLGVTAILYYNRGVELAKAKKFQEAARVSLAALCLDRGNPSAATNVSSNLNNWALALVDEPKSATDFERSLKILTLGNRIDPSDRTVAKNREVVWRKFANWFITKSEPQKAIDVVRRAEADLKNPRVKEWQIQLLRQLAQPSVDKEKWHEALAIAKQADEWVDKELHRDVVLWHGGLYIQWSNKHRDRHEYEDCLKALEEGLANLPKDRRIQTNIAFTIQEWLKTEPRMMIDIFKLAKARYPDDRRVHSVLLAYTNRAIRKQLGASRFADALKENEKLTRIHGDRKEAKRLYQFIYDRWATSYAKKKDWKKAVEIYKTAIKERGDDKHFRRNGAVMVGKWAHELQTASKWAEAKKVYEKGIASFPGERFLVSNLKYVEKKLGAP